MDANHSSRTERRCLYRRTPGRRATSREHFLPESFGHGHPFVLRIGVVCDACNRWAARKLDPSLLRVGMQALDLFFHGVRGKRGELKRLEGAGVASLHRVPAGPLAAVIPSLHLYPEIQSFRMDAPRWRPDSKQAPP